MEENIIKGTKFMLKVPEDMIEMEDQDGNVILDESGKPLMGFDLWCYSEFFALNIQKKVTLEETGIHYDGMHLGNFCNVFFKRYMNTNHLVEFLNADTGFADFQRGMSEKYGVHVNVMALAVLSYFISEIVQNKYVWLLAPTLEDTLKEMDGFDSVSFQKEGKLLHVTSNKATLKMIRDSLKVPQSGKTEYFIEKVVKRGEIFTKELIQGAFVYYISHFLNQYFKINRRNGAIVSVLEQDFICYLLYKFGLATGKLSVNRYRQLKGIPEEILFRDNWLEFPVGKDGRKIAFQLDMIKYKDWKKGKINILQDEIEELESGAQLQFMGEDLKSPVFNE